MTRLFLSALAGMLVALLLAAASAYWLVAAPASPPDDEVEADMRRAAPALLERLASVPTEQWDEALMDLGDDEGVLLSLIEVEDLGLPAYERGQLAAGEPLFLTTEEGGPTLWYLLPGNEYILDLSLLETVEPPRVSDLALAALATLAAVAVAGLTLVIPLVRRLRAIEASVRRFGNGEWGSRADDSHPDAIGDVGRAMNGMAQKIEHLMQHQRELLQAVAHELRGPLSRLVFALEAERDLGGTERRVGAREDVDEAVEDLQQLISEVLRFSRLQPGGEPLRVSHVMVEDVVDLVVRQAQDLNPRLAVRVSSMSARVGLAHVDQDCLRRALGNIVENACRYAHDKVLVSCACASQHFTLTVDDDGPGIPPYQRERAFEPFTRTDPSRSRHSGGTGLGLAIVKRISEHHRGCVGIDDSPLGGARLVMRWPLQPSEADAENVDFKLKAPLPA